MQQGTHCHIAWNTGNRTYRVDSTSTRSPATSREQMFHQKKEKEKETSREQMEALSCNNICCCIQIINDMLNNQFGMVLPAQPIGSTQSQKRSKETYFVTRTLF